jgi:hypothetical protein
MIIDIPTNSDFTLKADVSRWTGAEVLELDGTVISRNKGWHFVTAHVFDRVEDSKTVRYEVNFISGLFTPGFILRRDGVIVSHG